VLGLVNPDAHNIPTKRLKNENRGQKEMNEGRRKTALLAERSLAWAEERAPRRENREIK